MEYYDIKSTDGITITDIPKDIKPGDPRVKARYEQIKAMGRPAGSFGAGPGPGTAPGTAAPAIDPVQQPLSVPQGIARGLGQGTAASIRGLAGGVANTIGTVVDPATAVINTILDAVGAPPEMRGQTLLSATNSLLKMVGMPESDTMAAKIVESASRGLGGAATGVGVGQAVAGVPEIAKRIAPKLGASAIETIGKNMASGPVQQAMGGVGSELGSEAASNKAREMGYGPIVQGVAGAVGGIGGGIAGSSLGNAVNLRPAGVNPMQDIVDDPRFKTELKTSDVFPPETKAEQAAQLASENVLFGTGKGRAAQQKDRIEDIKTTIERFGGYDVDDATRKVTADLISKRADNFVRWENLKQQALESVAEAKPGIKVPMPKTIKSIDESIEYLKGLNNPDLETAIQKLTNYKSSFQNQSPVNVLKNKQILGDVFDAPEMSALKRTASSELKKTYEAVNDDLTKFIGEAGGEQAKNKWMISNRKETELYKELDTKILDRVLEEGKVRPEAARSMLFNKDRSVIESLNKNLTAKGREAAKTAIMQEVARKIGEDASPDKFLTEMRKLRTGSDPVGMFFTGDDLKWVEGLTRMLKASNRASKFAVNTPTGQQFYIPGGMLVGASMTEGLSNILGGGQTNAMIAAGAGIAGMGLAGLAARAYESPGVRNLLMKLPKVKAGSTEETALVNRVMESLKAYKARETDKETQ